MQITPGISQDKRKRLTNFSFLEQENSGGICSCWETSQRVYILNTALAQRIFTVLAMREEWKLEKSETEIYEELLQQGVK